MAYTEFVLKFAEMQNAIFLSKGGSQMKKRIAALVLCLALVFALAACGEAAPATESAAPTERCGYAGEHL